MAYMLSRHTTTLREDLEGLRHNTSMAIGALKHEMHSDFKKRDDRLGHMEKSIDDIRSDDQNLRLSGPPQLHRQRRERGSPTRWCWEGGTPAPIGSTDLPAHRSGSAASPLASRTWRHGCQTRGAPQQHDAPPGVSVGRTLERPPPFLSAQAARQASL